MTYFHPLTSSFFSFFFSLTHFFSPLLILSSSSLFFSPFTLDLFLPPHLPFLPSLFPLPASPSVTFPFPSSSPSFFLSFLAYFSFTYCLSLPSLHLLVMNFSSRSFPLTLSLSPPFLDPFLPLLLPFPFTSSSFDSYFPFHHPPITQIFVDILDILLTTPKNIT